MPPDHSIGWAIWQDGEQSLRLLFVNHCCLSEVLQPHSGDIHECDSDTLPQLWDTICYHSQWDDGQSLVLRKRHLRHKTNLAFLQKIRTPLFVLVGILFQICCQYRQKCVCSPRLKLDICLSDCHWQPSGQWVCQKSLFSFPHSEKFDYFAPTLRPPQTESSAEW